MAFLRRAGYVVNDRRDILLVIAAGGVLGSLARWAVGLAVPHTGRQFPWSTFSVNVLGCALIGALMWFEEERWPPSRYRRSFLRTGILGGFTTFSAYGLDTHGLVLAAAPGTAVGYAAASLLCCLAAVPVGAGTASLLAGSAR